MSLFSESALFVLCRVFSLRLTWKKTPRTSFSSQSGYRTTREVQEAALCLHPDFKIFEIGTCLGLCHREGQKKESRKGGGGRGGEGSPSRGRSGRSFTGSCRRQWQRLGRQQRRWEVKKKRVWCQCWSLSVELQISANMYLMALPGKLPEWNRPKGLVGCQERLVMMRTSKWFLWKASVSMRHYKYFFIFFRSHRTRSTFVFKLIKFSASASTLRDSCGVCRSGKKARILDAEGLALGCQIATSKKRARDLMDGSFHRWVSPFRSSVLWTWLK